MVGVDRLLVGSPLTALGGTLPLVRRAFRLSAA